MIRVSGHDYDTTLTSISLAASYELQLSAIEIHESNTQVISSELAPPPIPSSYRINLGGGTYVDSSGRTWLADQFFNEGGEVESIPNQIPEISGTLDDELYTTARYDPDSSPGLKVRE